MLDRFSGLQLRAIWRDCKHFFEAHDSGSRRAGSDWEPVNLKSNIIAFFLAKVLADRSIESNSTAKSGQTFPCILKEVERDLPPQRGRVYYIIDVRQWSIGKTRL